MSTSYPKSGNGANKKGEVKKCDSSNSWPGNASKTNYPDKKPSAYSGDKNRVTRVGQNNSWPGNASKTSYPKKLHGTFGTGG